MAKEKSGAGKSVIIKDLAPRIVCVFLAVIIWLYAVYNSNPNYEKSFDGVEVVPLNSGMLDDRELTVYGEIHSTIEVVIYGKRGNITTYEKEDLQASVDLIGITEEGVHTVDVNVVAPDGATVKNFSPKTINVRVEKVDVKEVPVVAVPKYTSAYVSGEPIPSVEKATVKGPKTELELVHHVEARPAFDASLTTSMTAIGASLVACTKDGSVIESSYIGIEPATVDVEIPIYEEREVELKVAQTNPYFDGIIESITVSPATMKIRQRLNGTSTLEDVDSLTVARFDEGALTGAKRTEQITLPVSISSAYENVDGIEEITVSVTYKQNTTAMSFNCSNIEITNPKNQSYQLKTDSLEVDIRVPSTTAITLSVLENAFEDFVLEGNLADVEDGRVKLSLNIPDEYEGLIYAVGTYYAEVVIK